MARKDDWWLELEKGAPKHHNWERVGRSSRGAWTCWSDAESGREMQMNLRPDFCPWCGKPTVKKDAIGSRHSCYEGHCPAWNKDGAP